MVIDYDVYGLCMCVINIPLFYQPQKWGWVLFLYSVENNVNNICNGKMFITYNTNRG